MFSITVIHFSQDTGLKMPVSLSEWRVRIGRYVQLRQDDNASIIESCRTHFKSLLRLLSNTYSPKKKDRTQLHSTTNKCVSRTCNTEERLSSSGRYTSPSLIRRAGRGVESDICFFSCNCSCIFILQLIP